MIYLSLLWHLLVYFGFLLFVLISKYPVGLFSSYLNVLRHLSLTPVVAKTMKKNLLHFKFKFKVLLKGIFIFYIVCFLSIKAH